MGVARLLLPRFNNGECSSPLSRILRFFSTSAAMIQRPWVYDLGELEESIGESEVYRRALKFQRPSTVKFQENMLNSVSLIGFISAPLKNYDTASGRIGVYTSLKVDSSARAYRSFTVMLSFWNELAEIAVEHLKLRDLIYVSGSLVSYHEMDEDGKSIYRHKVMVAEVFFSSPDEWWDNRNNKRNPKHPDFKHKDTGEALWLKDTDPPWVKKQLLLHDSRLNKRGSKKHINALSQLSPLVFDDTPRN